MKKFFDKDEVWFAIVWILVYVMGFANADSMSDTIGIPKLLTVLFGFMLTIILYSFIRTHHLSHYFGLCFPTSKPKAYLYYLPLILISSVNFWCGVTIQASFLEITLYILSMCLVGFLEEVIFRGLLFKGMCKSNVTAAIIVSSLTFGVGHIINLFLGEPVFDTLLQLVYASAIGFCYTAIFHVSGSILPCILSHTFVNSTSIFAIPPSPAANIVITIAQTVLGVGYGLWLLRRANAT